MRIWPGLSVARKAIAALFALLAFLFAVAGFFWFLASYYSPWNDWLMQNVPVFIDVTGRYLWVWVGALVVSVVGLVVVLVRFPVPMSPEVRSRMAELGPLLVRRMRHFRDKEYARATFSGPPDPLSDPIADDFAANAWTEMRETYDEVHALVGGRLLELVEAPYATMREAHNLMNEQHHAQGTELLHKASDQLDAAKGEIDSFEKRLKSELHQ